MKERTRLFFVLSLSLIIFSSEVLAQSPAKEKFIVDVSLMPPCVILQDGKFSGFDIDIWEEIARRLDYNFEFKAVEFSQIFTDLEALSADAALGGITITQDRETKIDFTHPTLKSGLRIAAQTSVQENSISQTVMGAVYELVGSWSFIKFIFLLIAVLIVLGLILQAVEMIGEDNPTLRKGFFPGLSDACWCVWAQMTTMGFGDIVPKRVLGRALSLPSYIFGTIVLAMMVSAVNAKVTTDIMEQAKSNISGPRDLAERKVATVVDSTSVEFLKKYEAKVVTTADENQAFAKLMAGEVEAVVFDSPAVMYFVNNYSGSKPITMIDKIFDEQYYGIALSPNSPKRESINQALLALIEDGTYDRLAAKWFGSLK